MKLTLSLFFACLFLSAPAFSACEAWNQSFAERSDLVIGSIDIQTATVFNTDIQEEGRWIHRLANKWHVETRPSVIRNHLLFQTDQPYSRRLLQESARKLRASGYFYSAEISETEVCDGRVNVSVDTRDNWSLSASFSYERAGGFNDFSFKVSEINLFGLGRELAYQFARTVDRDRQIVFYRDNQFLNSPKRFSLLLEDNSDGGGYTVRLAKPFLSLDDRSSWDVKASDVVSSRSMFENSAPIRTLNIDAQNMYASHGFSSGLVGDSVVRYTAGWAYDRRLINDLTSSAISERVFSYPFIGFAFIQDKFVKKRHLNAKGTVEDVSLGHHVTASFGWATKKAGSTDTALLVNGSYSKGFQPSEKILAKLQLNFSTQYTDDSIAHGRISARFNWRYFLSRRQQFYIETDVAAIDKPYIDEQLVVGGDTGLRGYPLKYQSGDRRYRFTAEYRLFSDWFPWRLFRLGAAIFADTGSAWYSDRGHSENLSDVGSGLRIVSARQANNSVFHIDLAFPLGNRDDISGVQLVIKTKTEF